jgi:hypothetical protein
LRSNIERACWHLSIQLSLAIESGFLPTANSPPSGHSLVTGHLVAEGKNEMARQIGRKNYIVHKQFRICFAYLS